MPRAATNSAIRAYPFPRQTAELPIDTYAFLSASASAWYNSPLGHVGCFLHQYL